MSFDPDKAFEKIANGDAAALSFCSVTYGYLHLIDDLFDGDKRTPDDVAVFLISFAETLASNPFFQANKVVLMTMFRAGVVAWAGSEHLRSSLDTQDKVAAEVVKSWYHELFYMVAAITGGLAHALECAKEFRRYDFS